VSESRYAVRPKADRDLDDQAFYMRLLAPLNLATAF
jgi:hypothetical protein